MLDFQSPMSKHYKTQHGLDHFLSDVAYLPVWKNQYYDSSPLTTFFLFMGIVSPLLKPPPPSLLMTTEYGEG